ncbi:hypothetical protein BI347_15175 [Chromobacterium sphagni]|uniref:Uncharacterized protein n=1 Tax=Chromobacterium sphagni TaxID=1903179 RepID=A0A1S1X685_9NEIS|nr:hypothetical protein [Chromobacterium sphagni]OHX14696.1 hypothetical protein BI347_15175 [Chromobacterium sphagni]
MANPLTLLMPIRQDADLASLADAIRESQPRLRRALASLGTIHYARLLLLDRAAPNLQPGPTPSQNHVLAIIGEYDGSFDACIVGLAGEAGPIFDTLLQFVEDGAGLIPAANHVAPLSAFVSRNNASQHAPNQDQYQAYAATAQEIMAALP